MRLFKLYYIDEMTNPGQVFDEIEILTEEKFRDEFWQSVDEGRITEETLENFGITKHTARDYFLTKDMVKVFWDDGYECEVIEV